MISELNNDYGLRIKKSRKGKSSINQGIDKLQSLKIICDTSLVNCKEEFYSYSYKFDKVMGKFTNIPEDKNNHLMDALRYSLQSASDKVSVQLFRGVI